MEIYELIEKIRSERNCGITHLIIQDRQVSVAAQESIFEILNACFGAELTNSIDFNDVLIEIKNKELASAILTNLLNSDMAYNYPIMSLETAKQMAGHYLDLFDDSARIFTNSTWNYNEHSLISKEFKLGLSSWSSLTTATFDSGIILYDSKRIGIAWFEDED